MTTVHNQFPQMHHNKTGRKRGINLELRILLDNRISIIINERNKQKGRQKT